jgi:HK97 family phage major capsid protein/HK97 family phage prohead protease
MPLAGPGRGVEEFPDPPLGAGFDFRRFSAKLAIAIARAIALRSRHGCGISGERALATASASAIDSGMAEPHADRETRAVTAGLEVRAEPGAPPTLTGYAAVYNSKSLDLGGWVEVVKPGAFTRSLTSNPDVRALINHDASQIIGRTRAGTLTLTEDAHGLRVEITPPATSVGRDAIENVRSGLIDAMSFAFTTKRDTWTPGADGGPPVRELHDVDLIDVSLAAFAAYPETSVAARRSLERWQASHEPRSGAPTMPDTPTPVPASVVTPPADPAPPIPPETRDVEVVDAETRMLPRGQSFAAWVEARSHPPRELAHVKLGDLLRARITGPRNDAEKRVLSESVDAGGGVTVPDVLLARWIDRLRNALAVARAGAIVVPLTSDVTKVARLVSDPVAAWRSENAPVVESDPAFEAVTFTPHSLDVFTKVSRELLEDSLNAADMIEASLVRSFAVKVDATCLYGSGTAPEPRGLRTTANVNELSMGANGAVLANYEPIVDLLALLWTDNVTNVDTAIMAPRTLATIAKFKDSGPNQPLARPPALLNWTFLSTANVPINETQGSATNASTLFLGDWSQMLLGFRTTMQIEVAPELFRGNYQFGYYGHLRFDMQVQHPESFGRLIGIIP